MWNLFLRTLIKIIKKKNIKEYLVNLDKLHTVRKLRKKQIFFTRVRYLSDLSKGDIVIDPVLIQFLKHNNTSPDIGYVYSIEDNIANILYRKDCSVIFYGEYSSFLEHSQNQIRYNSKNEPFVVLDVSNLLVIKNCR